MKRLVLLRHGQTAWNAEGRGQGHADVPLDETGRLQAKAAAAVLAGYHPSSLWSSDLSRAAQSAQYVADATGLTPTHDARLREYSLGERTGLTMDEFATRFPAEYAVFRTGRFEPVPGGERAHEVLARFLPALADVAAGLGEGETAVVVSHGAALRLALVHLLGWPRAADLTLSGLENSGWAVLSQVEQDGPTRWRLSAYNVTAQDPDFASGPGVG